MGMLFLSALNTRDHPVLMAILMVGAVMVVLMEEYLRDFKDLRFSIFGLILIIVVLFVPQGMVGFIAKRHEKYAGERGGNA